MKKIYGNIEEMVTNLLNKESIKSIDGKLINCLEESPSSKFYNELFSEEKVRQTIPVLYEEVKRRYSEEGTAYKIMEEIVKLLEAKVPQDGLVLEIGGGVHQRRSADAYKRFKNYIPLDISLSSIARYSSKYDKTGIVADATMLPFKDASVDCIFTHTFLEHPLDPEKVLLEIVRVLKKGGIVVHNDAWFCRWWQKYGVVGLKPFVKMNFKEKCIFIASRVTEMPIFKLTPIIIKRLRNELNNGKKENNALYFQKLDPNYKLHLGCDEDAASRLDPIDVLNFYESRGFESLSSLNFRQRLFFPNKYIILQKLK